jgi:tol-pal system protein YbgF
MRRSPRSLFLALITAAVLLTLPVVEARASKADREEADQQKREAAAEARLRASSRRMAEVLVQEEIARNERLERRDREAAAAAKPAARQASGPEQVAGPTEDTGLDAVFGRNERLTVPTGSQDRYYMPESIPPSGMGAETTAGGPTASPRTTADLPPSSPRPTAGQPGSPTVAVPGAPQTIGTADLELFHSGYSNYSKGDFAAARRSFASFLAANPGHELADSAQYWLGQCAAAEGDYSQALAEYRRVIESFPFGDKVPDALLKSGEALMELGREGEARSAWEQLARDFPDTGPGRRARERLGEGADVASADAL